MTDRPNLVHDLFLLLINLSQLTDRKLVLRLFVQAMQSMWPALSMTYHENLPGEGEGFLNLETINKQFGVIEVAGGLDKLPKEERQLLSNSAQMLALLLERLNQSALLRSQTRLLEQEVSGQTALLREKNEQLELAMEGARFGFWDWDVNGGMVSYSRIWGEILEYDPDEVRQDFSFWESRIHPDDRTATLAALDNHMAGRTKFFHKDHRLQSKSGDWVWVVGRGSITERNEDGSPRRVTGVMVDISRRKFAEEALKQSEERFHLALSAVSDGLWDWNLEKDIVFFSPRYYEMLGYEPDAFPPSVESWQALLHPEDRDRALDVLFEYLREVEQEGRRDLFSVEFRMKSSDGGWVWILSRGRVTALDDEGSPLRLIGTHVDITSRKRTDELMVQTEKMMSIGGLAAGMAHEINNPLAGILAIAQNLSNRLLRITPKNQEYADRYGLSLDAMKQYLEQRGIPAMLSGITESATRAARIVSNMLSFSRKSQIRTSSYNIAELLDQTLELARSDYELKKNYDFKNMDIEREFSPDTPMVLCEGSQIQQVFLNIVKNAAEAMAEKHYEQDRPRLKLRVYRDPTSVVAEIEDNGPGMEEDVRRRIFEPFYTTKPTGKGTGLGLSVSYFIITDQHKGTMEVTSSPGNGTRFIIRIPFTRNQAATPAVAAARHTPS